MRRKHLGITMTYYLPCTEWIENVLSKFTVKSSNNQLNVFFCLMYDNHINWAVENIYPEHIVSNKLSAYSIYMSICLNVCGGFDYSILTHCVCSFSIENSMSGYLLVVFPLFQIFPLFAFRHTTFGFQSFPFLLFFVLLVLILLSNFSFSFQRH